MTISFSQNISQDSTVLITGKQLKTANLIFLEHKKLLNENNLLYKQIDSYKKINNSWLKTDSIRKIQISQYSCKINELNNSLNNKNKELTIWRIGGISISTIFVLWLLLN